MSSISSNPAEGSSTPAPISDNEGVEGTKPPASQEPRTISTFNDLTDDEQKKVCMGIAMEMCNRMKKDFDNARRRQKEREKVQG